MESKKINLVFDFFNSLAYKKSKDLPDADPNSWKMPYEAIEIVTELKQKYKISIYFDETVGLESLDDVFQATFPGVFTLEDTGFGPSVKSFADKICEEFEDDQLCFVVSDRLEDVTCRQNREYRGVWFNNYYGAVEKRAQNIQDLKKITENPDPEKKINEPNFTIMSLRQLCSIFSHSAVVDNKFVLQSDQDYWQLAVENKLPSQQRTRYGMLYDDLEKKFLGKPSIQAMLADRPNYVCVPINVDDDLDAYQHCFSKNAERNVIVQKIMLLMNGLTQNPSSPEYIKASKDWARINNFLAKTNTKMMDEIDACLHISDRIKFVQKFAEFMATLPAEMQELYGTPLYFDFHNKGTIEEKIAAYQTQAKAIGLDFPVLVKFQNGAKNDLAHIFYCVNNEEGLNESLSFEGFNGKMLLIQAYRPHYEQVYKVYCIKDWYNAEIRLSLPEKVIFGSNAYQFDTQIPFDKNDFTEFDATTDRLNPLTVQFIKAFADFYRLNFYGVDILVEKGTGRHLVIDCNYLPNYQKVPFAEIIERLDALLDNEIVLSQQAEVKEEVEKDTEMPLLESQRTLDLSGKQEQEIAQETEADIDKEAPRSKSFWIGASVVALALGYIAVRTYQKKQ